MDVEIGEFDGFPDIFVTHADFDHISDLPEIVRSNPEVKVHCTAAPYATLVRKGVPERNLDDLMLEEGVTGRKTQKSES